nr:hypothetical protein [Methylomarinum sp. Ch1-1]MDP4521746.1 hypothetical protein [Methylomarinum sp. Ch1-1]
MNSVKKLIKFLSVMLMLMPFAALDAAKPFEIEELEFKGTRVMDIIRVLSEDARNNIIATPEAGEKKVTIFLKKVTLEQAIRAICRISDLWYRRDESGAFRLMTKEQYSKDLVVGQDDAIRVFQLRNPNVIAIASAIEDLYGDRVEVSYGRNVTGAGGNVGQGNNRFGGRGNAGNNSRRNNSRNRNRNGSGRSGSGTLSRQQTLPEDLTVEQLAALSAGGSQVEAGQLASVSGMSKLIYVTVNTEHNLLIVKTSDPTILKSIASLVEQLDRPQTQVMLEMKIVDIKVGEDFNSLFNFELTDTKLSGDSVNPIILGGAAALSGAAAWFTSSSVRTSRPISSCWNKTTASTSFPTRCWWRPIIGRRRCSSARNGSW